MKFLLDTDTGIYALKQNENVLRYLLTAAREDVVLSVATEAELHSGVAKSSSAARTLRRVEKSLLPLTVIDFTSDDAIVYAGLRARLERAGTPIGALDTLIAAHAVDRKLTPGHVGYPASTSSFLLGGALEGI